MPRIAGVNIPENKRIEISLTYIYGIGRSLSKRILEEMKIDINKKASELSVKEVNDLKSFIEKNIQSSLIILLKVFGKIFWVNLPFQ